MIPRFFSFSYMLPERRNGRTPWAMSLSAPFVSSGVKCQYCGACPGRFQGTGRAEGMIGGFWADIMGSGSGGNGPSFMISERVANALAAINACGFEIFPVEVAGIESETLAWLPTPRYFYLSIFGRLQIDWVASGINPPCEHCGAPLAAQIQTPHRLIPSPADAPDISFGQPYGGPFCSLSILELAHKNRWTNLIFNPIDVNHEHALNWSGIDYLGKQWPPKWYPDAPSDGKTLEQWVRDFCDDDWHVNYPARLALLDMGTDSVAAMIRLLDVGTDQQRRRTAEVLRGISTQGVQLPSEVLAKVAEILSDSD